NSTFRPSANVTERTPWAMALSMRSRSSNVNVSVLTAILLSVEVYRANHRPGHHADAAPRPSPYPPSPAAPAAAASALPAAPSEIARSVPLPPGHRRGSPTPRSVAGASPTRAP